MYVSLDVDRCGACWATSSMKSRANYLMREAPTPGPTPEDVMETNCGPRKVVTIDARISKKVPPCCPPGICRSASRCSGVARSSISGCIVGSEPRNPLPAVCDVSVTNVCNAACDFCGFSRDKKLAGPRRYVDLADFTRALPILRRRRIRYMTLQ